MSVTKNDIEQRYLVLNDGRVFSKRTNRELIGKVDRYGYRVMCLSLSLGVKHIPVHRLVALCHISNSGNLPQINHKDGNKLNNAAENLEWCSASHNTKHAFETGLSTAWNKGKSGVYPAGLISSMKKNQPGRKPVTVFKDGYAIEDYDSIRDLCVKMGFDRRTAMRVLKGEQGYNTIKGYKICYQ